MQAQSAPPPLTAAAGSSNSPLSSAEPGEFTRMLQSPLAPVGGPAVTPLMFPPSTPGAGASPLGAAEPGEFTRMLQSPVPQGRGPAPAPSMFPPSTPGGFKEAGEFTRMFESPSAPQGLMGQPLAAPPPRQQATGDATRAFQAQQAAPGAPAPQGPSEFTKMFKAPAPAPPEPPAPKAVKKPAGRLPIPKKKTNTLLWVLIGIAVLLALVLIVYLIVK